MQYQTISVGQTRANLAEIIDQVSIGKETFAITKFGKLKALITPINETSFQTQKTRKKQLLSSLDKTSGIFKDRKEMKDAGKWVANQRKPRYEKIFN